MRWNNDGILVEKPVGICPQCGDAVYKSDEIDGVFEKKIAWVCASDLDPRNVFYAGSDVTPEEMRRAFNDSYCPKEYERECSLDHFPLHNQCYYRWRGIWSKVY